MSDLKSTPITAWHAANGGKMVDFAGYSMPVSYEGVLAEHAAVREACGIFDVSHMSEFFIKGKDAVSSVDRLVTNDVAKLEDGQVLYTAMCKPDGGIIDDLLIYRFDAETMAIVGNASNHAKDAAWIADHLEGDASFTDQTATTALFAVQGPRSREMLAAWSRLAEHPGLIEELGYYRCMWAGEGAEHLLISRTGYTGELGYELYVPVGIALDVWKELIELGKAHGLKPIGLGARDSLRLEAAFSLYGHELDEGATPHESGIGWTVRLKASDFIGRDSIVDQKEDGIPHKTLGLLPEGKGIPREGAKVLSGGKVVGHLTSGGFSPTLQRAVALARIQSSAVGQELKIELRGRELDAKPAELPFVPNRTRD